MRQTFIRLPAVRQLTGLSRTTVFDLMRAGRFRDLTARLRGDWTKSRRGLPRGGSRGLATVS